MNTETEAPPEPRIRLRAEWRWAWRFNLWHADGPRADVKYHADGSVSTFGTTPNDVVLAVIMANDPTTFQRAIMEMAVPVELGEVCPAGYFTTREHGKTTIHADVHASHDTTEAACDEARAHRTRILVSGYPQLTTQLVVQRVRIGELGAALDDEKRGRAHAFALALETKNNTVTDDQVRRAATALYNCNEALRLFPENSDG